MKNKIVKIVAIIVAAITAAVFTVTAVIKEKQANEPIKQSVALSGEHAGAAFYLDSIPEFSGEPYVTINNNIPDFTASDLTTSSYEHYGPLDRLGRCTTCIACLGQDLMPTGRRESISSVKPTGWRVSRYSFVDGESLYNRCHLIAFMLAGENDNSKNLITGTRYMNAEGMLPFETQVCDYIRETDNHVLYRVTPIFKDKELVARGVQMEAYSVEDNGASICFNVYCYNNQPKIEIDYATGKNREVNAQTNTKKQKYVLNTNSMKFHYPDCDSVQEMNPKSRKDITSTRDDLIDEGYEPCGSCRP